MLATRLFHFSSLAVLLQTAYVLCSPGATADLFTVYAHTHARICSRSRTCLILLRNGFGLNRHNLDVGGGEAAGGIDNRCNKKKFLVVRPQLSNSKPNQKLELEQQIWIFEAVLLINCLEDWNPQFLICTSIYQKRRILRSCGWGLTIHAGQFFFFLSLRMNKCLEMVNDQNIWNPGIFSYAMILRCCPNSRDFFHRRIYSLWLVDTFAGSTTLLYRSGRTSSSRFKPSWSVLICSFWARSPILHIYFCLKQLFEDITCFPMLSKFCYFSCHYEKIFWKQAPKQLYPSLSTRGFGLTVCIALDLN